jgi:sugar O-acyltransferase (sialic acid O-acetyltransferase NeuD family)
MKNIILFGASGHSTVIIDILEKNNFNIIGLLDDNISIGKFILKYPILGKIDDLKIITKQYNINCGIISIGDNYTRYMVYKKIIKINKNFNFITAIHPKANIANSAHICEGSVIMAGANINSESIVNKFCIVNTNASLEHTSNMDDFSSLAPSVTTGGNVNIGKFSAICISATISHNINIGKYCVIGASSLVLKNIDDFTTSYGIPAKTISIRKKDDKYL